MSQESTQAISSAGKQEHYKSRDKDFNLHSGGRSWGSEKRSPFWSTCEVGHKQRREGMAKTRGVGGQQEAASPGSSRLRELLSSIRQWVRGPLSAGSAIGKKGWMGSREERGWAGTHRRLCIYLLGLPTIHLQRVIHLHLTHLMEIPLPTSSCLSHIGKGILGNIDPNLLKLTWYKLP